MGCDVRFCTLGQPLARPARKRAGYVYEGRRHGLIQPAAAGFVGLAAGFSPPACGRAKPCVTPPAMRQCR